MPLPVPKKLPPEVRELLELKTADEMVERLNKLPPQMQKTAVVAMVNRLYKASNQLERLTAKSRLTHIQILAAVTAALLGDADAEAVRGLLAARTHKQKRPPDARDTARALLDLLQKVEEPSQTAVKRWLLPLTEDKSG